MNRIYTLFEKIIEDRSYKMVGTVNSSSPLTITLPNSVRGLLHISSASSARTGLYSIVTSSAGVVTIVDMVGASQLTVSSPSNNTLNITSISTSNAYVAWCGRYSIDVN